MAWIMDTGRSASCMPRASRLGSAFPDEELVVGQHCVVGRELQSLLARQVVQCLEIANAALGGAVAQILIEGGVAFAGVPAAIAERPVDAQHGRNAEYAADAAKEILHRAPTHDVQRVGAEHS